LKALLQIGWRLLSRDQLATHKDSERGILANSKAMQLHEVLQILLRLIGRLRLLNPIEK